MGMKNMVINPATAPTKIAKAKAAEKLMGALGTMHATPQKASPIAKGVKIKGKTIRLPQKEPVWSAEQLNMMKRAEQTRLPTTGVVDSRTSVHDEAGDYVSADGVTMSTVWLDNSSWATPSSKGRRPASRRFMFAPIFKTISIVCPGIMNSGDELAVETSLATVLRKYDAKSPVGIGTVAIAVSRPVEHKGEIYDLTVLAIKGIKLHNFTATSDPAEIYGPLIVTNAATVLPPSIAAMVKSMPGSPGARGMGSRTFGFSTSAAKQNNVLEKDRAAPSADYLTEGIATSAPTSSLRGLAVHRGADEDGEGANDEEGRVTRQRWRWRVASSTAKADAADVWGVESVAVVLGAEAPIRVMCVGLYPYDQDVLPPIATALSYSPFFCSGQAHGEGVRDDEVQGSEEDCEGENVLARSLEPGRVPKEWKIAKTVLLHKPKRKDYMMANIIRPSRSSPRWARRWIEDRSTDSCPRHTLEREMRATMHALSYVCEDFKAWRGKTTLSLVCQRSSGCDCDRFWRYRALGTRLLHGPTSLHACQSSSDAQGSALALSFFCCLTQTSCRARCGTALRWQSSTTIRRGVVKQLAWSAVLLVADYAPPVGYPTATHDMKKLLPQSQKITALATAEVEVGLLPMEQRMRKQTIAFWLSVHKLGPKMSSWTECSKLNFRT
ncbi:hypothetical protein K491DRAFT_682810 [Lophiostoma macrostomum CBS 122681]|uniref:Uncharacterized protein n=1 Tax=Lophiostoma macrostomum CBS 122681 TaxID=1314788 RepID=A0A6A6SSP2_9PLEO|nr:hypothetical protein K491DRAFT_682810 [Lophiostoma macrostomum CBS 122681]